MPIEASRVSAVIPISDRLWRTSVPSLFGASSSCLLLGSSVPAWYAPAYRRVALVGLAIPDLHPVPHAEHHHLLADPDRFAQPLRDRHAALPVELRLVGRAEEQPCVRAAVGVGKGRGRDLVGTPLPFDPGEARTGSRPGRWSARRRPRTPRGTARQRHPALGVELIAVRAEQFGHASSPFLHFGPRLCHQHSTASTANSVEQMGSVARRERRERRGTSGEETGPVQLEAGSPPSRARAGRG